MSVIRNRSSKSHFTITPNATLRDNRLSLKAKGLLALMLSFPDDWDYHMSHLANFSTDGREAHRSAMRELIDAGYVSREPNRLPSGQLKGWVFYVSDVSSGRPTGNPSDGDPPPTKKDLDEELVDEEKPLSASPTLAPKSSSSSKERATKEQVEKLVAIYNEHCDVLPSVQAINASRERKVKRVIKEHGFEKACELIRKATLAVARDDFWRSKRKYGFDNLLAGGKYLQKAESFTADSGPVERHEVSEGQYVGFRHKVGAMEVVAYGHVEAIVADGKQVEVAVMDDQAIMPGTYRVPVTHIAEVRGG